MQFKAQLLLDHFNRAIAQWEPVIENCLPVLEVSQSAQTGMTDLRLEMATSLELVISDDALNGLYGAAARLSEAFTAPLPQLVKRRKRPPYALRNETGVDVFYGRAGTRPTDGRRIAAGEQHDVALWALDPVQVRHFPVP